MVAFAHALTALPVVETVVLKATAVLAAGWCLQWALQGRNPRWRVLLWRTVLVGLSLLIPAQTLLPAVPLFAAPQEAVSGAADEIPVAVTRAHTSNAAETVVEASVPSSVVPESARGASPWPDGRGILEALWIAVVCILGVRLFVQAQRLNALLRETTPGSASLRAALQEQAERLGLARIPELRLTQRAVSPFVTGWLRPVIVLPETLTAERYERDVRGILTHELAHLKSRDLFWMALAHGVALALWFHPLAWRLARAYGTACEEVCDGVAARLSGGGMKFAQTLARAYVDLVMDAAQPIGLPMLRPSEISRRVRQLKAGLHVPELGRVRAVALGCAGVCALTLLGCLKSECPPQCPPPTTVPATTPATTASVTPPAAVKAKVETEKVDDPKAVEAFMRKMIEDRMRNERNQTSPNALAVLPNPAEHALEGRVVDEAGQPVEGAWVDCWSWCPGNDAKTDKDGRFRIGNTDDHEGQVELRISKNGFAPVEIAKQAIGTLAAPVVLNKRTLFEGVVKGPDGKPVAGALIRGDSGPQQAPGVFMGAVYNETKSGPDGSYSLLVQDGTYEFLVTAPGGLALRQPGLTVAKYERKRADFELKPGVVFRAVILDSQTHAPVPGVRLWHWEHKGVEGRSDAQGHVTIAGMLPGKFEFDVDAKGYARWWSEQCVSQSHRLNPDRFRNFDYLDFELKLDMAPVTIEVERGVKIAGKVLDPDGQPVAGATVDPAHTGTGNSLSGDTRFSKRTKPDGTFELLVPAGNEDKYNLTAHDGKYGQWRKWANGVLPPIQTKPGDELKDITIRLTRPSTVSGSVVDAAGKPVANREVRAVAADLLENRYYDPTTRTDKNGRFELKFVRPGEHNIQAAPFWLRAKNAPDGTSVRVKAEAGQTTADVKLNAGQDER